MPEWDSMYGASSKAAFDKGIAPKGKATWSPPRDGPSTRTIHHGPTIKPTITPQIKPKLGPQSNWQKFVTKMRGWNEEDDRPNTQAEYEANVQNRRDRSSIERLKKTRGLYETGVIDRPGGWEASELSKKLGRLEKEQFGSDYVDYGRNRDIREEAKLREGITGTNAALGTIFSSPKQNFNPAWSNVAKNNIIDPSGKVNYASMFGGIGNIDWSKLNPLKKDLTEYFYPSEHGDKYIGLQTGEIPTENYHRDVTADYWQNVSKNWGEIHPALGAMVNVGAPAGTMIGGLMYDTGQGLSRYKEDPNKYLSPFMQKVKATEFEPEVKAALESRGITDYSGVDLIGSANAISAENPITSNLQRMAGSVQPLLSSWGIGNNLSYAQGGLADLWPR